MQACMTKHEAMMAEIMTFTNMIVGITEMKTVSLKEKANAIFFAEKLLHKVVMDNMVHVADNAVAGSSN